ncbi:hypothetical protein HDU93_002773 [Gonapodya sp. JEL0774]|nr:hypothetical protein HDU93_002773 [Gonapodya sp. JEL0774]
MVCIPPIPDLDEHAPVLKQFRNHAPDSDVDAVHLTWTPRFVKMGETEGAVLLLHGGAHIAGSTETHRWFAWRLARAAGQCFSLHYSLAPARPFPSALRDSTTAYLRMIDPPLPTNGNTSPITPTPLPPSKIVLAGDSAGGNLVLATLLTLRESGIPLPAGAVLFSPWLDLSHSLGSQTECVHDYLPDGHRDPFLVNEKRLTYYAPNSLLSNPYVSPLFADPHDLPPLLVTCGSAERLRDDALLFAWRANTRGGRVALECYEDMVHVFQVRSKSGKCYSVSRGGSPWCPE